MSAERQSQRRILGIDPGSLRTGFGIIEERAGQNIHVAHGTIMLDPQKKITDRFMDLARDLAQVIEKYQPTNAAVEDIFLFKNPRSALTLGQARGVVLAVLGMRNIAVESLSASRVKSLILGHGKAKKFQIAQMVAFLLNIEVPISEDSSDALAVAIAYAYSKVILLN